MMNLRALLNKNWRQIPKWLPILFLVGGFIGFIDSSYLSVLHYKNIIPPCSLLEGCETVLTSRYAVIWGVPTALVGAFYYLAVVILSVLYLDTKQIKYLAAAMGAITLGFLFTIWLLYLQAFIIKTFCEYCLLSAGVTTVLFAAVLVSVVRLRLSDPNN